MSTVIVHLNVKQDCEGEFLRLFSEVAKRVAKEEPECRVYAAWKTDVPLRYCHIVSYKSDSGRTYHAELHKETIGDSFLACLSSDPEVELLDNIIVDAHNYYFRR